MTETVRLGVRRVKAPSPRRLGVELENVTYNRKVGAACPNCGRKKASVVRSMDWEDDVRIRYHKCRFCQNTFKSVESFVPEE